MPNDDETILMSHKLDNFCIDQFDKIEVPETTPYSIYGMI